MYHQSYERAVRFCSEGQFEPILAQARQEYVERTGDMFDSDESIERRLSAFVEWYLLDRPLGQDFAGKTPIQVYMSEDPGDEGLPVLAASRVSLFEFKKFNESKLKVVDLLTGDKVEVFERRNPAGLESGDVMEARLLPFAERNLFTESFCVHPRVVRRQIKSVAKSFLKKPGALTPLDVVHRVSYFTNRCERYKHVEPKKIFGELTYPFEIG